MTSEPLNPASPPPIDVGVAALPDTAPAPKPVRQIPAWLVAIVILGCLGGAAWFVWQNWLRSGPAERIVFLDRGPDDGVKPLAGGKFEVRSGIAGLSVTKTGEKEADVYFKWVVPEYMTSEQKEVLQVVLRLSNDGAMAAALKVTPEQVEQLKVNRAKAKMELPESDRTRLRDLFLAYDAEKEKDAKRAAETKLIKALDAVAAELEGPAKQTAAERTAHAKTVITPQQFKQFKALGQ